MNNMTIWSELGVPFYTATIYGFVQHNPNVCYLSLALMTLVKLGSTATDCIPAYDRALVHLQDGFCVEILSHLCTTWTA